MYVECVGKDLVRYIFQSKPIWCIETYLVSDVTYENLELETAAPFVDQQTLFMRRVLLLVINVNTLIWRMMVQ